jgi:hypothetical protein
MPRTKKITRELYRVNEIINKKKQEMVWVVEENFSMKVLHH